MTVSPAAIMARGLIRGYKLAIAPLLPPACRFEPTCSDYAFQALGRFGLMRGGWLAVRRLGRCHPWGGFGYDPVPDPTPAASATGHRHTCSSPSCPPLA